MQQILSNNDPHITSCGTTLSCIECLYTEHDFIIDILAVNQRSNYDQQFITWHRTLVSQSFIKSSRVFGQTRLSVNTSLHTMFGYIWP